MLAMSSGRTRSGQALAAHHFLFKLGRVPQFNLALGPDGARRDCIHANIRRAVLARLRAREADYGGFAGDVRGKAGVREAPDDRTHVDDGAAAETLHLRRDRVGGEKHVAEIDGDAIVPVGRSYGVERMAVVAGGVVDEDGDIAEDGVSFFDGESQGVDVADVAGGRNVAWRLPFRRRFSARGPGLVRRRCRGMRRVRFVARNLR